MTCICVCLYLATLLSLLRIALCVMTTTFMHSVHISPPHTRTQVVGVLLRGVRGSQPPDLPRQNRILTFQGLTTLRFIKDHCVGRFKVEPQTRVLFQL